MSDTLQQLASEMNAAVLRESSIRELSLLNVHYHVGGLPIRQLTPRMYLLLDFTNSPFIKGLKEEIENSKLEAYVQDFVWICSPEFVEYDVKKKTEFIKTNFVKMDYARCLDDILEYLDDMLMDIPRGRNEFTNKKYIPQYYAWIIGYIDILSSEFSWTDEDILGKSIPRILQLCNAITQRRTAAAGRKSQLLNPISDPILKKIRDEQIRILKEKDGRLSIQS